ncbi:hypothetical protein VT84_30695 [Gemmata sp. SH-PL17]|uniref:hypothetical protein n=1 Tax=Gemmata sp. SH-PL17 TaxID=1630693 RepID=UPI00078BE6DD|nr:hypothetical protein [Gemmata sp. SH-PL17]AMV28802.1 hypothetical protein VT84_30695 [Gemmata sp. SH-PL17]
MEITLRESLTVGSIGRVDRAANTIRDVRVCGLRSTNGRRYSAGALRNAKQLYEGARAFFNHPDGESNTRKFGDRIGRLVNVREADDGGLIADLKYNPKHRDAEAFLWLAEHDPAGMGLSHNAEGRGVRQGDGEILVEEITKVHSVDIVDNPATNLSLFEQDTSMDPVVDPAAGASGSGGGDVNDKLAALAADFAKHPEWDKKTKITKLKALINLMEDGDADAKGADDEMSEGEMMEQLGAFRSPAVRRARAQLLVESRRRLASEKGLAGDLVTGVFLEQLAAVPEATALKLIEDRRGVATVAKATAPKSTQQVVAVEKTAAEIAAEINW